MQNECGQKTVKPPARGGGDLRVLRIADLGRCAYTPAWRLQERIAEARRAGAVPDTLLLVEHDPVYTLGRNAAPEHVLLQAAELRQRGIEVVRTSRGGDVTYHGPGQLVGYPILDLADLEGSAVWYVDRLEELLQGVLRDFGLRGHTDPAHRGVWIGSDKIAAIGVRVTRGITLHGFALNVQVDLAAFRGIVPCGIADRGVTSLHCHVRGAGMDAAKKRVVRHCCGVFGHDVLRRAAPGEALA